MTRKELLRLMPKNATDIEGANRIIELGYPVIEPVHTDMIYSMRVADSPVGDAFSAYFAQVGASAAPAVAERSKGQTNCFVSQR